MRIRVIFSPVWLHEEALARLPAPLHLGRSVSRLPNCLNSRARVYRVTSEPLVITIRAYIHSGDRLPRLLLRQRCMPIYHADRYLWGFCAAKVSGYVFTRFVDATGYWARCGATPRREEFFEFFAWFANTVGIYSNTSIRSGNILTRRNFDSRASPTTMIAMSKSLKRRRDHQDCSLILITAR